MHDDEDLARIWERIEGDVRRLTDYELALLMHRARPHVYPHPGSDPDRNERE